MAKGDYSHKFDPDKLRDLILQKKNAKEIMKILGISLWSLKEQLLLLEHKDKKFYDIPGLYDSDLQKYKEVSLTKEGILITDELLRKTGFQEGDECELIIETDKIIIKKL